MKADFQRAADEHRWNLRDATVTQLVIDPASVRIVSWHLRGSTDIRLGQCFTYTEADGTERLVDPGHPEQAAPLLALVTHRIDEVTVHRSGVLHLRFGDGSRIRIEPHPQFEAWEARGEGALGDLNYLCIPGGGPPWGAA